MRALTPLFNLLYCLLGLEWVFRLFQGGFLEQLPGYEKADWIWQNLDALADFFYWPYRWLDQWVLSPYGPENLHQWLPVMPADTLPELASTALSLLPVVSGWPMIQGIVHADWGSVLTGVWDWGLLIGYTALAVLEGLLSLPVKRARS